jgi:predicted transcriptional regulator
MPAHEKQKKQQNAISKFKGADEGFATCYEADIDDPEGRDWQFRIAVLPTPDNLQKARAVLDNFVSTEPLYQQKDSLYPRIKIIGPKHNPSQWNPTLSSLTSEPVADRDQRGKEICVYMSVHKSQYMLSPSEYKTLILKLWKALEDAGVELSYVTPAHDEFELPCEAEILTPICYSAYKPYSLREGVRNGILLANSANPKDFPDPLTGIEITVSDLRKYKTRGGTGSIVAAKRVEYQRKNLQLAKEQTQKEISSLFEKDNEEYSYKSFRHALEKAQLLLQHIDNTEEKIEEAFTFLREQSWRTLIPRVPDSAQNQIDLLSQIDSALKKLANTQIKSTIEERKSLADKWLKAIIEQQEFVQTELNEIKKDFEKITVWEGLKSIFTGENILEKTEKKPCVFQALYRRLIHIQHAEARLKREEQRLQAYAFPPGYVDIWNSLREKNSAFEKAKALLLDYTKNDSRAKRIGTFHWNRHHVSEITSILSNKAIDNIDKLKEHLLSINLKNPTGSLAKRIGFILKMIVDENSVQSAKEFTVALRQQ